MKQITDSVPKFLWYYFSQYKTFLLTLLFMYFFNELFIRLSLYYIAQIAQMLSLDLSKQEIILKASFYIIIATVLYLINVAILSWLYWIEAKFMPYIAARIKKDLFSYAHQHSTAFFTEEMAGNVAAKIESINDTVYPMYYNLRQGFLYPGIAILMTISFLVSINLTLALILIVMMIIIITSMFIISKQFAVISKKEAHADNYAEGVLVDSILNADLVKNFSKYTFEKKHYFSSLKIAARLDRQSTLCYGRMFATHNVLVAIFQIIFLFIPLIYWYYNKITVAEFIFVQSLIMIIINLFISFSSRFTDFFGYYGKIKNGLELLAKPYEIVDVKDAKDLIIKNPEIEYKNVFYSYKTSNPLFANFSLDIKSKQKIGLVGYSGAGKSTFIKLLLRYYDLQSGEILIDGQNIKNVKQNSLRNKIAVISQETNLFNRTIMENIKYGNSKATDEQIYDAAKKAYIHDFIMSLPNQYQTKVGDRGIILSGGERQRVAIARAILKDAPILVLDEATSALDSQSEKYIQQSLKTLMKEKTVIAIAHRLSTLREMDKIIVMNRGKVIESGTHKYLLSKKGHYHNLYSMQSSGFIDI